MKQVLLNFLQRLGETSCWQIKNARVIFLVYNLSRNQKQLCELQARKVD